MTSPTSKQALRGRQTVTSLLAQGLLASEVITGELALATYLPFLCIAIALSWPAFASAYRQHDALSRGELATAAIGSSIFLGAMAMLFIDGSLLVGALLFADGMAIALLANRWLISRWSLLAAATSFGSYLIGAAH